MQIVSSRVVIFKLITSIDSQYVLVIMCTCTISSPTRSWTLWGTILLLLSSPKPSLPCSPLPQPYTCRKEETWPTANSKCSKIWHFYEEERSISRIPWRFTKTRFTLKKVVPLLHLLMQLNAILQLQCQPGDKQIIYCYSFCVNDEHLN